MPTRSALCALLLALPACLTETVDPGAGARVLAVTPDSLRLAVGELRLLEVAVRDSTGAAVPGATVQFFSTAPAIAQVTGVGVVTAVAPGQAAIVVESAGSSVRVPVVTGLRFSHITAGAVHSCGLVPTGALYCWGGNGAGQLGLGDRADRLLPARVPGTWIAVGAGSTMTCALSAARALSCWGGTDDAPVERAPGPWRALTVGTQHACALTLDSLAWCWGRNAGGQVGDGSFSDRAAPVPVAGGRRFSALSAGATHTCGLTASGQAWCWGDNAGGQLALDTLRTVPQPTPGPAADTLRFQAISAGRAAYTCAVGLDGRAWCWGEATGGRLGIGPAAGLVLVPRPVGNPLAPDTARFRALSAGLAHACGRTTDDRLACWGTSRLGLPGLYLATSPVVVDSGAAGVSAGALHTCLTRADGQGLCWGGGLDGALGLGTRASHDTPQPVALQLGQPGG